MKLNNRSITSIFKFPNEISFDKLKSYFSKKTTKYNGSVFVDIKGKTIKVFKKAIHITHTKCIPSTNKIWKDFMDMADIKIWRKKNYHFFCQEFKDIVIQLYLINKKLRVFHKDILPVIIEIIANDYIPRNYYIMSRYIFNKINLDKLKKLLELNKSVNFIFDNNNDFFHDSIKIYHKNKRIMLISSNNVYMVTDNMKDEEKYVNIISKYLHLCYV